MTCRGKSLLKHIIQRGRIIFFAGLFPTLPLVLGAAAQSPALPPEWIGDWKGPLVISSGARQGKEVRVELHVHPIKDSTDFTWTIVYETDGKRDERPYILKPIADAPGRFVVDERNGILLDHRFLDGKMYCQFQVAGNLICFRHEVKGERMNVEVIVYDAVSPRSSEGAGETVRSFQLTGRQEATLERAPVK